MQYRANGKHPVPSPSESSRLPPTQTEESWTHQLEATVGQAHDVLMAKSTEFIQQRPGTSLLLAAIVGGVIGWFIKRRE